MLRPQNALSRWWAVWALTVTGTPLLLMQAQHPLPFAAALLAGLCLLFLASAKILQPPPDAGTEPGPGERNLAYGLVLGGTVASLAVYFCGCLSFP